MRWLLLSTCRMSAVVQSRVRLRSAHVLLLQIGMAVRNRGHGRMTRLVCVLVISRMCLRKCWHNESQCCVSFVFFFSRFSLVAYERVQTAWPGVALCGSL